jgi:hypothetical protein
MRIDRETEGVDTRIHSVCVLYKPRNELKKVEYVHILTGIALITPPFGVSSAMRICTPVL